MGTLEIRHLQIRGRGRDLISSFFRVFYIKDTSESFIVRRFFLFLLKGFKPFRGRKMVKLLTFDNFFRPLRHSH